jgi:hypothetical protein
LEKIFDSVTTDSFQNPMTKHLLLFDSIFSLPSHSLTQLATFLLFTLRTASLALSMPIFASSQQLINPPDLVSSNSQTRLQSLNGKASLAEDEEDPIRLFFSRIKSYTLPLSKVSQLKLSLSLSAVLPKEKESEDLMEMHSLLTEVSFQLRLLCLLLPDALYPSHCVSLQTVEFSDCSTCCLLCCYLKYSESDQRHLFLHDL